jgi:hypothetical protein
MSTCSFCMFDIVLLVAPSCWGSTSLIWQLGVGSGWRYLLALSACSTLCCCWVLLVVGALLPWYGRSTTLFSHKSCSSCLYCPFSIVGFLLVMVVAMIVAGASWSSHCRNNTTTTRVILARQLSPHVRPMPMEALPFGLGWVWPAKPPHPYKPLGLLGGALPHRQETFCISTKS